MSYVKKGTHPHFINNSKLNYPILICQFLYLTLNT